MIIQRYIFREIGLTFAGVSTLLVLMYLSGTFVRLLAEALEGDFPTDLLFALFALKGGGNIVFILPLSLFLAVMLALGRLYQDSEMAAMQACGVGPGVFFRSVAMISLLVASLVGVMTLYITPMAEDRSYALLDEAKTRPEFDTLAKGRFTPLGDNGPLIYVEERKGDGDNVSGVFAQFRENGRDIVFTAKRATKRVEPESGYVYLVLHDGFRYDGKPGQRNYRMLQFEEYGFRLRDRKVVASQRPRHAIGSRELMSSSDADDAAELQWRVAIPVSTVLLAFLAVLLSKTSPRSGRFGKMFVGIVVYLVYNNLLTVARSYIGKGVLPAEIGFWLVHAAMVLAIVVLYRRQQSMGKARAVKEVATA